MQEIITAKNIKKRWQNKTKNSSSLTFTIKQSEIVYILGESGAGKTTLLNILCGYDKKFSGNLKVMDCTWHNDDEYLRSLVGYVPQESRNTLYGNLTVIETMCVYNRLFNVDNSQSDEEDVIRAWLKFVSIDKERNKRLNTLSGGQLKRVSIAVELLKRPQILILDEPDSGLDYENRRFLKNKLELLADRYNMTIVLSTHYNDEINSKSRVIYLENVNSITYDGDMKHCNEYRKIDEKITQQI